MNGLDNEAVRERVERAERLLTGLEHLPDDVSRQTATQAVQALLEIYGEALRRIQDAAREGNGAVERLLADDELVSHLMLIHGLQPAEVEQRLLENIEQAASKRGPARGPDIPKPAVSGPAFIPASALQVRRRDTSEVREP